MHLKKCFQQIFLALGNYWLGKCMALMFKETNTELPFLYMNDNWLLCKNKACFDWLAILTRDQAKFERFSYILSNSYRWN